MDEVNCCSSFHVSSRVLGVHFILQKKKFRAKTVFMLKYMFANDGKIIKFHQERTE